MPTAATHTRHRGSAATTAGAPSAASSGDGVVSDRLRARIPADVDASDRILGDLTARQVAVLAVAAATGYLTWQALHARVPVLVLVLAGIPIAGLAVALALVRRDGLGLDTWLAHAAAYARAPRRLLPARVPPPPPWAPATQSSQASQGPGFGVLRFPADAVDRDGTIRTSTQTRPARSRRANQHNHGGRPKSVPSSAAVLVGVSTLNVTTRTPGDQAGLRDFVRATLGVPRSSFDMTRVLDGGILIARLPKGQLGEDTAKLMGSFVLASVWQAATARARIPEPRRRDASIYIDEAHNVLNLAGSVADMLAEARGYRLSLTVAHQDLAQFPRETVLAISANARNKIFFSCSPEDAHALARHTLPELDEHDLAHLDAFTAAARLVVDARTTPAFTLHTRLPRPELGLTSALREAIARPVGTRPTDGPRTAGDDGGTRRSDTPVLTTAASSPPRTTPGTTPGVSG